MRQLLRKFFLAKMPRFAHTANSQCHSQRIGAGHLYRINISSIFKSEGAFVGGLSASFQCDLALSFVPQKNSVAQCV